MEVELETFAEDEDEDDEDDEDEEEEEDTIELGEVQELGTEILEMILEQVFGADDVEPQSSLGSTTVQLSQAPPEHVDVDRGACEESGVERQFSEHTQEETHVPTIAEEPNLEVLGSTATALGKESNALSFRWAMEGRVYTKTEDGYYYDLEGMRYHRLREEGQYTYKQVASVFKADDDHVSSPAVDAMVSKAINYVTADTPPRLPTPQSCSSYMIAEHLRTKDRTRYQLSHL
jgi:hypothetical protein